MNESVSRSKVTSVWMALLAMQVNIAPYSFASLLCLTAKGPNMPDYKGSTVSERDTPI